MAYKIEISPATRRQIKKFDKVIQRRILQALERLETDPRPHGYTKLKVGEDIYRIRVGDYCILYEIRDPERIVLIAKVEHRREAYRD